MSDRRRFLGTATFGHTGHPETRLLNVLCRPGVEFRHD
jgi:hypothetical protein